MYQGDFKIGKTIRYWFPTLVDGVPATFSSVTVEVYKDGSLVQVTTGITHAENVDGKTGWNSIFVDTSADGSFYASGSDFMVIAIGTLNAVSGIQGGQFHFSLENRCVNWAQVVSPSSTVSLPGTTVGVVSSLASGAIAAAAFAAGALDAVWSTGTRVLTAGTNIALTKGVGLLGLNDVSAAQVNAEAVDAVSVDTFAEPGQGTPAATISLAAKIGYLYKLARNRVTSDAGNIKVYADDGVTVDHKFSQTDDTVTYNRGEIVSGP